MKPLGPRANPINWFNKMPTLAVALLYFQCCNKSHTVSVHVLLRLGKAMWPGFHKVPYPGLSHIIDSNPWNSCEDSQQMGP